MIQHVSDVASNAPEQIDRAARVIGKSTHRRMVFEATYTGKRRAKTVTELMSATGLSRVRVLDAGKRLFDNKIVEQTKIDGETAYVKIGFFQTEKQKILGLAKSPQKLNAYPTKRNSKSNTTVTVKIKRDNAQTRYVTIDDIDTFKRAWKIKVRGMVGDKYSETEFKLGMLSIMGDSGEFKDYGGETSDVYTTRLVLSGKRKSTAIALKGPARKGKLTPAGMGKQGDQIQRLFREPADVFLVQYCRQIEPSVINQMETHAIARSLYLGKPVWYGTIDGQDSKRLVLAYPAAFKSKKRR
ncbi:MAG TPA: hypothetical protein VGT99_08535 [Gammaproteobacteria bacterium]|nr:hypothetical protein [Gammaproteobacteria bacterium]